MRINLIREYNNGNIYIFIPGSVFIITNEREKAYIRQWFKESESWNFTKEEQYNYIAYMIGEWF